MFAGLIAFGGYFNSLPPGSQATVDYMAAQGGPAQAQRVSVTLAPGGQSTLPRQDATPPTGMSTGTKVVFGAGVAAQFGCYEMGCFSHRRVKTPPQVGDVRKLGSAYRSPSQVPARP
jgi:hypothetical protein